MLIFAPSSEQRQNQALSENPLIYLFHCAQSCCSEVAFRAQHRYWLIVACCGQRVQGGPRSFCLHSLRRLPTLLGPPCLSTDLFICSLQPRTRATSPAARRGVPPPVGSDTPSASPCRSPSATRSTAPSVRRAWSSCAPCPPGTPRAAWGPGSR